MMTNIDTRNLDALAGAVYFTVGRGTEGGSPASSYRLSVAGVDRNEWGQPSAVAENSGYSIGTIQVDLGQRGTWPLGATSGRPLREGETTYVDGIIAQAADYARRNGLTFPDDTTQLRADLLTHGDGGTRRDGSRRDTITFIDPAVRDSLNAWAGSDEGKRWIHSNIDYPQVRNATETAMNILDRSGSHIAEDRRFETINILAKTANQYPGRLDQLENVLRRGGDYDALLAEARSIPGAYAGDKAAAVAQTYEDQYAADPNRRAAMDRAHTAVASRDYDPANERNNADVQQALGAIGAGARQRTGGNAVLEQGESGRDVRKLESNLAGLGYHDAQGQPLAVDGRFTAETKQAVESYQRDAGLASVDGRAGPQTLGSIDQAVRGLQQNLNTLEIRDADGQALGVDGYLGDGTRAAVRTFQQDNGLAPTGIADETTRTAIETAARERSQAQPVATPTPETPSPASATPRTEGPQSFDEVMRVMLPPQDGATPHMTSDFGPRTINGRHDDHGGVDFNYNVRQTGINLEHPTVRSPVSGVVEYGDGQGSYGTVKIRDDQGNLHEILHLDSRSVRATDPPTRVEAGDPIGTMGGRGPGGASDYAQHVHYQMRDSEGRIIDPEAFWNDRTRTQGDATPTPAAATPTRSEAMADNVLRRNEQGPEVGHHQRLLADLGYVGADGKPIAVDEKFGANTEFAARQFQRDHGIEQLGVIGPKTRAALESAGSALVTHPDHPNNPMYERMLEKVHAAEEGRGIPHGEHSRKVAAALTVEALREGIQPDKVELSKDGSLVRAVQFSAMGDRQELNRATDPIATGQAANQPIRESSEQAAQVANNVAAQQRDQAFTQQQSPQEAVTQAGRAR
jgi:peptidoglycan hydrolase-like protein with peptidoglycan-binding domain